jgi:ABC-type sugar transport system permease subunit
MSKVGGTPPPGEPEEGPAAVGPGREGPDGPARETPHEPAPWVAPDTPPDQGGASRPGWQDTPEPDEPGAGGDPERDRAASWSTPPGWQAPPGSQAPPGWGTPGYQPPLQLPKGGSARTGPLPLHPMTFGDLLDGALKLLKANLATIVLISAAIFVPLELLSAFLTRDLLGGHGFLDLVSDPSLLDGEAGVSLSPRLVGGDLVSLIGLVITPLVGGAITQVVTASYLGRTLSAGEAIKTTGRRVWALLGASICVHLVELVGTLLCLLPGLAAMALLACTTPAVMVEGLGPIKGMRRSVELVRRRFWPVLGIAVVSGLMASLLSFILGFPFAAAGALIGLRWGFLLVAVGSILPALIASPFVSIVATLIYFDGRIRHEGFDLQLTARDLRHGAAPSS